MGGLARRKIQSGEKNRRALRIKGFQKKVHLIFLLPPKPPTDLIADRCRCHNPTCRPSPNQQQRKFSMKEELEQLDKVIEKVSARLRFLEYIAKYNPVNSSNQGGDHTSTRTDTGDSTADQS